MGEIESGWDWTDIYVHGISARLPKALIPKCGGLTTYMHGVPARLHALLGMGRGFA